MENETKTPEEMRESNFNDRMDVLKHVSAIKLGIRKDITSDFVLAKLGEKDKEFIIEMTGNAYFSKKLLDTIASKGWEYKWDSREQVYKKVVINEMDKNRIEAISKAVFDGYMTKIFMTVVLNRNVDKNYLINVLSGYNQEGDDGVEINSEERTKKMVQDLLADQSGGEK